MLIMVQITRVLNMLRAWRLIILVASGFAFTTSCEHVSEVIESNSKTLWRCPVPGSRLSVESDMLVMPPSGLTIDNHNLLKVSAGDRQATDTCASMLHYCTFFGVAF
jgi:hypothetical protein